MIERDLTDTEIFQEEVTFKLTFEGIVGVRMMDGEGAPPRKMLHHARKKWNELSGSGKEPKKSDLVVDLTRRNELGVACRCCIACGPWCLCLAQSCRTLTVPVHVTEFPPASTCLSLAIGADTALTQMELYPKEKPSIHD